jgi:hypothetical protein
MNRDEIKTLYIRKELKVMGIAPLLKLIACYFATPHHFLVWLTVYSC